MNLRLAISVVHPVRKLLCCRFCCVVSDWDNDGIPDILCGCGHYDGQWAGYIWCFHAESSDTSGTGPAWWYSRAVIDSAAGVTNDFAAANQGQLKWIARQGYEEMTNSSNWKPTEPQEVALTDLVDGLANAHNHAVANIGQVKCVAQPFYNWLGAKSGDTNHPWTDAALTNDYAPVNIGQLKNTFSFEIN